MATSYNGWPASRDPKAIGIDPNFTAAGRRFPGGVKAGDVATVLGYLIEQFDRRVEELDTYQAGDEWGYNYKQSANSRRLISCHASGTAVDLNATRHPNGRRGTFTAAQRTEIRRILGELSGVVKWGGDFSGTPDEMHFEIAAGTTAVAAVAARLRSQPTPPPQEDDMTPEQDRMLRDVHAVLTNENDPKSIHAHTTRLRDTLAEQIRRLARQLGLPVRDANGQPPEAV